MGTEKADRKDIMEMRRLLRDEFWEGKISYRELQERLEAVMNGQLSMDFDWSSDG